MFKFLSIFYTLLLIGCSSGGTDGVKSDSFGLTQREILANVNLPIGNSVIGSFSLVNAYPNLSFSNALFVSGIPGETRLVLVEQSGRAVVFADDPAVTSMREVLNIESGTTFSGEQGLLGFAFDPNFESNRHIFLYYSVSDPRRTRVSRMTWPSEVDLIDAASEKILLEIEQPFSNHNGGMLLFGPDDLLYIGVGDGGSGGDPQNHSQNRATLLGNILRIDVHPEDPTDSYTIPLDNPFLNLENVRPEIFAYGLRNPFRGSFDRQTGDLWVGDVGQGAREEVDIIKAGGNYGWRVFEGTQEYDGSVNQLPDSAFIPPVTEYDHSKGRSVIGGYVYRGSQHASLVGRYLYTDYTSGTVWALTLDGDQVGSTDIIGSVASPTGFGETNDGELLIVSRSSGVFKLDAPISSGQIPTELSQTGLFTDLAMLTPTNGLIEYSPNHAFWSDGTKKKRWISIPTATRVTFSEQDWQFPPGTVALKHFEINLVEGDPSTLRRLETRLLIHTDAGWQGFSYRWNTAGTDASLIVDRQSENLQILLANGSTRTQQYEYPGRSDCLQCHTESAGYTLGLTTPQLNSEFDYNGVVDNQLRSWNNIALFDQDTGDANRYTTLAPLDSDTATIEERARAYLDVNCSSCHQPDGPTATNLDLRHTTELSAMNALDANPVAGDLGIANAKIIASASKESSILWHRLQQLDENRMPPLSSHVVDTLAVDIVGRWIDTL